MREKSKNVLIHDARKKAGLTQWEVAELAGYREDSFSRKMRHELPEDEQKRIVKLIENNARAEKA